MKNIFFLGLLLVVILSAFTFKKYSKKEIDELTNAIDHYSAFYQQILDATEIYETTFDGGGEIKILWRGDEAKKIRQDIFLSYGKLSTTFYFDNNKIIKIIEAEEDFEFKEDMSLNYDKLTKVFEEEIYVLDNENEVIQQQITGKRVVSKEVAISEYYKTANFILEKLKK